MYLKIRSMSKIGQNDRSCSWSPTLQHHAVPSLAMVPALNANSPQSHAYSLPLHARIVEFNCLLQNDLSATRTPSFPTTFFSRRGGSPKEPLSSRNHCYRDLWIITSSPSAVATTATETTDTCLGCQARDNVPDDGHVFLSVRVSHHMSPPLNLSQEMPGDDPI